MRRFRRKREWWVRIRTRVIMRGVVRGSPMKTEALQVVALEGGPAARGLQHGELLRPKIHELLDRWDEALRRVYRIDRARYVERFYAETKFEQALKAHAPTVLEEIAGIAKGASADYRTLLAWQHINEE